MDLGNHPLRVVRRLQKVAGDEIVLSFSKYRYRPQSPIDERIVLQVPIHEVNESWLSRELHLLPEGWELALNSNISNSRGDIAHIPMIDFVGRLHPAVLRRDIRDTLGPTVLEHCEFYDSGRSLHGYVSGLISAEEWIGFMGGLLLLNLPGRVPLVDARWVGHRLRAGYASLRWSANTSHYVRLPALV